jgi:hypothetical protein
MGHLLRRYKTTDNDPQFAVVGRGWRWVRIHQVQRHQQVAVVVEVAAEVAAVAAVAAVVVVAAVAAVAARDAAPQVRNLPS